MTSTAPPDCHKAPKPGEPPVSVLMYHQVGDFERPDAHRANYCHIKRFRAQMAYLRAAGYSVISLQAAYEGLFHDAGVPKRAVVLTFDDGYRNFYEHALPVLRQHGFPATVFMVSGLIGENAQWLGPGRREASPMMAAGMLRELPGSGVTVGSHTVTHKRLARLAASEAREEIRASKATLEDMLGQNVAHFCYPYGNYDEAVRDAVAEAGYRTGLTCARGAANHANNPFEIPRKGISYGDNLAGYFWKLHMKHAKKDNKAPAEH